MFFFWLITEAGGESTWNDSSHTLDTWHGRISISAAFCEWLLSLLVVLFMLSFIPDFKSIRLASIVCFEQTVKPDNLLLQQHKISKVHAAAAIHGDDAVSLCLIDA